MKSQKVKMCEAPETSLLTNCEFSILEHIKLRLTALGWTLAFDRAEEEATFFNSLIPPPPVTLSVVDASAGESRCLAFHFYESGNDIRYVCSMQLAKGKQAHETGNFKKDVEELTVLTTHDEWMRQRPNLPLNDVTILKLSRNQGRVHLEKINPADDPTTVTKSRSRAVRRRKADEQGDALE